MSVPAVVLILGLLRIRRQAAAPSVSSKLHLTVRLFSSDSVTPLCGSEVARVRIVMLHRPLLWNVGRRHADASRVNKHDVNGSPRQFDRGNVQQVGGKNHETFNEPEPASGPAGSAL
ncbi:hypothetical protein EYF80_015055 [Liparis tanakae]|uniref:Secreted protein n=1 Tax=Liparis tanakae TaxID=230148 RepID=A0A4Z2I9W3_9TELE|nr:hypothetical protein EYF80_015055 [Liparis tanakae]